MRNWLIFIGIILIILAGLAIWLASMAGADVPADGEIRQEIENVI